MTSGLRIAGRIAGLAPIVGLIPLALWATSSGRLASDPTPPGDHGLSALELDGDERSTFECVINQLDTDPRWDSDFTVTKAANEEAVIEPATWRAYFSGSASIDLFEGQIVVRDGRGALYSETSRCGP